MKSLSTFLIAAAACGISAGEVSIHADDARLVYDGYLQKETVKSPAATPRVRFNRPFRHHYAADNPGAELRFRTDASQLELHLYYSDRHASKTARNGIGVFLIDGEGKPEWIFSPTARSIVRPPENVTVRLPADGRFHDYRIVLPYGDSVDIDGLTVNAEAKFESPAPVSDTRIVFYGDSVTHGFSASRIDRTYPYLIGRILNCDVINAALGGIASGNLDAAAIGAVPMDELVVMIGVNDWQGGAPPESYAAHVTRFLKEFRKLQPDTPVTFLTPLWVGPKWRPQTVKFPLEAYRTAAAEAIARLNDPGIRVVDGAELIDHDAEKYFDPVAVHPNDAGFAQLAERLAPRLAVSAKR